MVGVASCQPPGRGIEIACRFAAIGHFKLDSKTSSGNYCSRQVEQIVSASQNRLFDEKQTLASAALKAALEILTCDV